MSAPTPTPEPRRPATAREIFAALPGLLTDPYIPEVHGDDEQCSAFVPDAPRAPGLCATCGDSKAWHRTTPPPRIAALDVPLDVLEARIAEQHHQVDEDPVFEDLAIDHPDRCTRDDNWQPGGDR